MTFSGSITLKKMKTEAAEQFTAAEKQLQGLDQRILYRVGGKSRAGLVGAIFVSLIWGLVFIVLTVLSWQVMGVVRADYGELLFADVVEPRLFVVIGILSALALVFFLIIDDFARIRYFGKFLRSQDELRRLQSRVNLGRNGMETKLGEFTAAKERQWDVPLTAAGSVYDEVNRIENALSGMEALRGGFVHAVKNVFYYVTCVAWTIVGAYVIFALAYPLIEGEMEDKTLMIIMLVAAIVAVIAEIIIAKIVWGRTGCSVTNTTLLMTLNGPVVMLALALVVALVVLVVQLVAALLGVIIAGVVVYSCSCGG